MIGRGGGAAMVSPVQRVQVVESPFLEAQPQRTRELWRCPCGLSALVLPPRSALHLAGLAALIVLVIALGAVLVPLPSVWHLLHVTRF